MVAFVVVVVLFVVEVVLVVVLSLLEVVVVLFLRSCRRRINSNRKLHSRDEFGECTHKIYSVTDLDVIEVKCNFFFLCYFTGASS